MKKRLLASLLTVAMAATMLAGCSTPSTSDSDDSTSGSGSGEKVFRYAVNTEPTSLDPTLCNSIGDNEIQHALTEGLVRNTAGEVTPGIAESWDVSEDGLTYTFHLRDAKWSDGEDITAGDFVYSFQRLMDPETASPYAFSGECIKNGKAVETGELDPSELGISAPDDKTVVIELENPTSYFLSLLGSQGSFAPLRQDVVEEYGTEFAATADKNVYSGPFVLTSSENNEYIFEKNENYWDVDSINLDRTELSYIENTDTQLALYEQGDLDWVKIPSAYVSEYAGQDVSFVNGNVDYFYLNQSGDNPYLANKNFRLALNYALDRNSYISLATNDVYTASNTLVFPNLQGVDGTYGEEYTLDSYPLDGDQDKALEYLDAALEELNISDPSEISLEITTSDAESSKKIAEVVQELWQDTLGINITIRQVTYSELWTVLPQGDYDIGYGGWGADYDDPYSYLELFISDNDYNYSAYSNSEYDALMKATKTETDAKTRMDELNQAEQMIIDDGAFVPLQMREEHYLVNEKVTGLQYYYCSINIDWVYADITE
jgi:oligopeptide transport system substrate-binding protein